MDRQNRLEQFNTAPQPFKMFLAEQGQRQLQGDRSPQIRRVGEEPIRPLVSTGGSQLHRSNASTEQFTPESPRIGGINTQPLERQRQFLSTKGKISQQFGNRNPIERFSGGINTGTDIAVPRGTKVALPQGQWEVVEAFNGATGEGFIGDHTNKGYGNSILVRNQETGEMLRFSHLSDALVDAGQVLDGGTIVGLTGSTGNSTGPHLDLEYYNERGQIGDVLSSRYGGALLG